MVTVAMAAVPSGTSVGNTPFLWARSPNLSDEGRSRRTGAQGQRSQALRHWRVFRPEMSGSLFVLDRTCVIWVRWCFPPLLFPDWIEPAVARHSESTLTFTEFISCQSRPWRISGSDASERTNAATELWNQMRGNWNVTLKWDYCQTGRGKQTSCKNQSSKHLGRLLPWRWKGFCSGRAWDAKRAERGRIQTQKHTNISRLLNQRVSVVCWGHLSNKSATTNQTKTLVFIHVWQEVQDHFHDFLLSALYKLLENCTVQNRIKKSLNECVTSTLKHGFGKNSFFSL